MVLGFVRSIRGRIFIACGVIGMLAVAVGIYGVSGITRAGAIVEATYNKPLMAINFARSSALQFSEMDKERLRLAIGGAEGQAVERLRALQTVVFEDLAVAEERSLSPRAIETVHRIERLLDQYIVLLNAAPLDRLTASTAAKLDALALDLTEEFDVLAEITANDGFVERQKAIDQIGRARLLNIGAAILALLLAGLVTAFLARGIVRPLSAAVGVADQISKGRFETEIPVAARDEVGILLRSMAVMQDSIRKMMEREVAQRRSAQNRLADAFEGSREAMVLLDERGRIVIANDQAAGLLPAAAGRVVPGVPFDEAFGPVAGPDQDWPALLSTPGEVGLDGGRWLRVSRTATREGGCLLFWSDITDIKERENRLKRAMEAAEAASAAKTRFLATMSHELRTPLNAIIGFSEMIAQQQLGDLGNPDYAEFGDQILRSGRQLLDIVNGVLELARLPPGLSADSEDVDMGQLLKRCVAAIRPAGEGAQITVDVEVPAGLPPVRGDAARLRQAVLNLLSNAVKFSHPGGRVMVAAETAGPALIVRIRDEGIGMRPEDIPEALAPFGQLDGALSRQFEGVGLGLTLAKAFTELHGGTLEIMSAPGSGTTVVLRLPVAGHAFDAASPALSVVRAVG